jgi:hypothetical protein
MRGKPCIIRVSRPTDVGHEVVATGTGVRYFAAAMQEALSPNAAIPERSSDGGCLGQIMALIASQEFARDAKEHGVYSLPAVVRRAGHPCHNVGHVSVDT